jgi:hypothetical protein
MQDIETLLAKSLLLSDSGNRVGAKITWQLQV